ncbi:MAG: hypothetical protein A2W25_01400 [candidate division Zixibacteria bacterium RBG_16_53_22]|nr:MAG: hypothetical protein A2W25_01400 [candidate division Zixibacteria bacterium RBG_16_53_22]
MDTATAESLASTLINEAPEPSAQADAIAATLEQARSPGALGVPSAKVETRGRHKKGCPCPSCAAKTHAKASDPNTTSASDPFTPPAVVLVGTLTGMAQMFLDAEEWKPAKAETDQMVRAFHDLFQRYGITDVPVGVACLIAIGGYALPRFARPKTRTLVARFVDWVKGKRGTDNKEAKE